MDLDCAKTVSFARSLHMDSSKLAIMVTSNCSPSTEIIKTDGFITTIRWSGIGLYGAIDSSKLPTSLEQLYLSNNAINGSIPTTWPSSLQYLYLDYNKLTENIPSSSLPSNLHHLYLNHNFLSGPMPTIWPYTLQHIYLNDNQLTGGIPSTLPSSLKHFSIDNNQMSGALPAFPTSLTNIFLGYTGFNANRFSGTLQLNRPLSMYVSENLIRDIIISDYTGFGNDGNCDISYNPLLDSPNLSDLQNYCAHNGIYSLRAATSVITTTLKKVLSRSSSISARSSVYKVSSSSLSLSATYLMKSQTTKTTNTLPPIGNATRTSENSAFYLDSLTLPAIQAISTTLNLNPIPEMSASSAALSKLNFSDIMTINSSTKLDQTGPDAPAEAAIQPAYLLIAIGAFLGLCIFVLITSRFIKTPKIHSKFGRKNSFGTLNTVNTVATRGTV